MDIFFAINNAYVDKLMVTMCSILESNRKEKVNFYVLNDDLTEDSKKLFFKLRKEYNNWSVEFISLDASRFENLNLNINYITKETYYRFVIADLAPNLDKCLYLDADLVVDGSLKELWDTNLDGHYCAGVSDLYIERINHKSLINLESHEL